jgi:hypothetical protein
MARKGNIPRASKTTKPRAKSSALLRGQLTEDAGAVSAAASVLLPADVDLDTRAARMNNFWDALVEYQCRFGTEIAESSSAPRHMALR